LLNAGPVDLLSRRQDFSASAWRAAATPLTTVVPRASHPTSSPANAGGACCSSNSSSQHRHCKKRKRRSNPCFGLPRDGLLPPSLVEPRRTGRCARNDGEESRYGFAFPRRETPGGCFRTFPRRWREQGMPGARCTRGLVCKIVQRSAHEHTGSAEAIRHSLRNGFTAYAVLSPATNSSCHRRRRISGLADPVGSIKTSADLTPATGARTTRFCRPRTPSPSGLAGQCTPVKTFSKAGSAPFVLRASMIAHGKPALPIMSRPALPRPPHPVPTFVTMANAPRAGRDARAL
jgi:hypothetical protein